MKIAVVYNPASGSALPLAELRKRFNAANITVDAFIDITSDFDTTIKKWRADKEAIAAVIGGDGTVGSVASYLVDQPATLAPLPGGTLNHFTKDLGVAQDLDEALHNLASARPHAVDVASVNGKIFINNSSIGLYPSTLQTREQLAASKLGKWPAAVLATVKALIKYRTYTVTINDETFKTPFLFVGNNDYHLEDPTAGGRTQLNEGVLSVYTISSASRWGLVRLLLKALAGRISEANDVKIWKTTHLTIHTKKSSIRVSHDGELSKLRTPLEYKIHAGKLTVIGNL